MGTKVTVSDLTTIHTGPALATLNANFDKVADEFDKVVYKDGSTPFEGDLDMDSNRILNLPDAVSAGEPLTYRQGIILGLQGPQGPEGPPGEQGPDILDDLALSTGAAMIGAVGGGTVQDGIFIKGRATPIAGSKARILWLRDDSANPLENIAGLWPLEINIGNGFNKVFDSSFIGANSSTVFISAKNTGSVSDVVGLMAVADCASAGKTVFGANVIAFSSGGVSGYKLVGLEIDLQPQSGTTPNIIGGLYINVFTMEAPGPAIYIEGIYGGKWGTGLSVGNLSDNGAGIAPAEGNPRMGTLLDSGVAQYQIAAIKLNNLHKQLFYGVSGNPAAFYVDGSNYMHAVLPAAGFVFRDNTDTSSLVVVDNGGNLDLQSGGVIKVASSIVTTTATAGFRTLPSNPVDFITVYVGGLARKIPFYS